MKYMMTFWFFRPQKTIWCPCSPRISCYSQQIQLSAKWKQEGECIWPSTILNNKFSREIIADPGSDFPWALHSGHSIVWSISELHNLEQYFMLEWWKRQGSSPDHQGSSQTHGSCFFPSRRELQGCRGSFGVQPMENKSLLYITFLSIILF